MKFVSVSDLRLKPGQVRKGLDREEDFEKTVAAVRRARALMAMEGMQRASLAAGTDRMSDAAIEAEIKAARRSRAR